MKMLVEFRVIEEHASLLFLPNEGQRLGTTIRKIEIETGDPRFEEIGKLQRRLNAIGSSFYSGWRLRQVPTASEIQAAKLLKVTIGAVFEPAGEDRGTVYDDSLGCPVCGAGARQVGPLRLKCARVPKKHDIARTIAGEVVVSRRFVEVVGDKGLSGFEFGPVCNGRADQNISEVWFQLILPQGSLDLSPKTKVWNNMFDPDVRGEHRCPKGDLAGLNLASSVYLFGPIQDGKDILISRQYVGARRGVWRPERIIFIKPSVWRIVKDMNLSGISVEVAYVL